MSLATSIGRCSLAAALSLGLAACDEDRPRAGLPFERTETREACADHNPLRTVYFGDTHVHTTFSLDAGTQGTRITPEEAYRFALGERVGIQPHDPQGNPKRFLQLARPLDFAVVTDHAEFFGEVTMCTDPKYSQYNSPECILYRERPDEAFLALNLFLAQSPAPGQETLLRAPFCGVGGAECLRAARTPWREIQDAAEAFYDRTAECRFTTFVGYEWTGSPQSNNLHRNVIFRNHVVPELPASYLDKPTPELLWQVLREECNDGLPGCESLTIPHNSNLSAGLMFRTTDSAGRPFSVAYARERQLFEPLAEVFQHKGDSECFVLEPPGSEDELCAFEKIPWNNLAGDRFGDALTREPFARDFLRNAFAASWCLERILAAW